MREKRDELDSESVSGGEQQELRKKPGNRAVKYHFKNDGRKQEGNSRQDRTEFTKFS